MSKLGNEIAREVSLKMKRDPFMRRRAKEEAEEIRDFTRSRTPGPGPGEAHADCVHEAPYATGDTRESIVLERRRERFSMPHWWLGSRSPIINLLEYGTGPDNPGSRSPWGPDTPTPEFGMFAQTAARYRGTVD
jgi:hypothetical protein